MYIYFLNVLNTHQSFVCTVLRFFAHYCANVHILGNTKLFNEVGDELKQIKSSLLIMF